VQEKHFYSHLLSGQMRAASFRKQSNAMVLQSQTQYELGINELKIFIRSLIVHRFQELA